MSWTQVSSGTGPTGAEGPEGPAGGTAGIVLYCDPNDASDLAGYKTALLVPSAAAETPVTVTVTSSGTYVAVGSFATDPGSPASLSLAAGQYTYSFFGTTNSSTNRARLKYELYTCAADGSSETLRRTSTSDTFYSATVMHVDDSFLDQTGYTTAVTDRLVLKVSAARVSGDASFPVNVYFCGNNNASHTHTSAVAKTVAVAIQTTSGPTTLDITTIADGQYLKRSGTNVIGASATTTGFMSAIYMPSDIVTVLASGTSGQFARCNYAPSVLMLAAPTDFGANQASVASLSTWTQRNTANRSALSVSGGVLTLAANAGYGNGLASSYAIVRAIELGPYYQTVRRLTCPTNLAGTGLWYELSSAGAQYASWYYYATGTLEAAGNGSVRGSVALTAGSSVWLRTTISGGYAYLEYNTTNSATEPSTGWVPLATFAVPIQPVIYDCIWAQNHTSSAGGSSLTIAGLRESYGPPYVSRPALCANGYAAAPAAITLANIDAGSGSTFLPSQAALRLRLADAINQLPGDAGAWTFSMTGSASASPAAATTYQSASALELKDAGTDTVTTTAYRYWTLRAKCTSTGGLQSASVDLARLVIT